MSDQNPYEKLGVSEEASFDEIQDARNRLFEQYSGDAKRLEIIEAAYDAILMDRLRMRQEGKIKVPERIRFPELRVQSPPKESPTPREQSPAWLQRMLDQPTPADVLLPGAWYLGLSAISVFYPEAGDQVLQLALVVGVGVSIYFLNRKEGKFGRAVLFTLICLIIGLIAGGLVAGWLISQTPFITSNQFSTVLTFILLWLVSSFLR
ncbi:molecular chaperone DnaJ [Komarekiella sp. 'clone 1']|uniref:Molecular chaperone DnaJ n=1 Tax=Komarekiella delphini-convector SJRDD-AB1 TaxID=2593771 RepID=A0AA40SUK9_9NOST|nr:CPP1-like family protein [Komarekiella delphini-convector]MBD6615536.1 molecular chaperone DnaJ [Komarekiella delphini-convector SJRDD-AB1]